MANKLSRRAFVEGSAITAMSAAAAASLSFTSRNAWAAKDLSRYLASPPPGFTPLHLPGKVVKVTKGNDFASLMQPNQLWPRPEVARQMLERALTELTGAPSAGEAMKKFVHPSDVVAVKVNGIAGQRGATMAVNLELIQPVVEALLAAGVPANKITVFEQYPSYLLGTRVVNSKFKSVLPDGVKTGFHGNQDAAMPETPIFAQVKTRYVRFVTEATAVIDMTMMKDHSICGYTGALKNMTHGQIVNPQDHHATQCNPQIPTLYNHPILKGRVRLHLVDAYKIIYDGGPLDKNPEKRVPHGAVYASTDPVALDTVGWGVIDESRKAHGMRTLELSKREPRYIKTAAELGLGVVDLNQIKLKSVAI
jgi:uncharacterized protein (DUF362 family)